MEAIEEQSWSKRTGYKMSDRSLGYRGEKYDQKCFQRQLRDSYNISETLPLHPNTIREISFHEAQDLILKYEWLGTMGTTKFSVGIFHEEILVGCMCFGLTAGTSALSEVFGEDNKGKGIVLVRGACSPQAHPHTATYLFGQAKKILIEKGYLFSVAYSDPEAGEIGTIYQALGWKWYGWTSPVNYLVRPDGKRVDPKIIHKYAKKNGITSQEQKEIFLKEGYTFEKGGRKLKYFTTFGNRKEVHKLNKDLRVVARDHYLKRQPDMNNLYKENK